MRSKVHLRLLTALSVVMASTWAASCAVPFGPGYTIEKQQVRVRLAPEPEPRIRIEADFQLKNTGTRSLNELELRLPGRRFQASDLRASWDSHELALEKSPDNPRNMRVTFHEPWNQSARHTLRLTAEFSSAQEGETALRFSRDAFFLPASGWSPELLPPSGLFAEGGTPPKMWELLVAAPNGFQMHASGRQKKTARRNGEFTILAEQSAQDPYPFVIAGRYHTGEIGKGREKIHLWTLQPQESAGMREASEVLGRVAAAYDASFGERGKEAEETWIVECPMKENCFTNLNSATARLLGDEKSERTSAEMISQDTMVADLSGGTPKLAAAAAPSLAASWLGYGQNPAFYEQELPLALLPAFAAAVGREAAAGTETRGETIRRALGMVPAKANPHEAENAGVLRAKSFLFFYGLQDHYGRDAFRKAIVHMLYARRGRGFELDDLIAAFEQETHQNVAEFVRHWMKRPGVPEEFRARYEKTAAAGGLTEAQATNPLEPHKETRP